MDVIRRRNSRLPTNFKPPKKNTGVSADDPKSAPEATLNDLKTHGIARKKRVPSSTTSNPNLPAKVDLRQPSTMLKAVVPGHVFRCSTFPFRPQVFALESDALNPQFIEASVQVESLARFLRNPASRMIYCVAGNPDDVRAKYFAAYLVDEHIKAFGNKSNVMWHSVYGGFENPLMELNGKEAPSMLVLTGLTPNATNIKLEKARDLLERYPDIPRVVVTAGLDPISFMSTKLFSPVHGILYLADSMVKRKIEVI